MANSIEVPLGSKAEIGELLSWDSTSGVELYAWVEHGFNQTLLRDLMYGSWADVWDDGANLGVKITSPTEDVSAYGKVIPAFMNAARSAYSIYQANKASIDAHHLFFFLPAGLAMARIRSIQLLHYPPYEARTFTDYLYSNTNRRWESLLGYNGYDGAENTLVERIVDMVPLAGPGSDASGIDLFNDTFMPYAKTMLANLLDTKGPVTQPVVAYGSPAHEWLEKAFGDQIHQKLEVLSLVTLKIGDGPALTPVLCANHPSEFLFFKEHDQDPQWAPTIMRQDLIAAGWQARMSADRGASADEVLTAVEAFWDARPEDVTRIVADQEEEFGFQH